MRSTTRRAHRTMQPQSRMRPSACCLRSRPSRTGGATIAGLECAFPRQCRDASRPSHYTVNHPAGSSPRGAGAFVSTGERMLGMTRSMGPRRTWCLLLLCAALGVARADDADPPGRAAQLSDAEGAVSLQPAGVQEWTAATLNRPLTTGDRLWSDQGSRAELDLGTAGLRLGSNTAFAFLNLDDHSVQMQLSAGTIIVAVRDLQGGESYEVDTPNIALALQQAGVYRVEVNDQGTATAAAVSSGAAQAAGDGHTVAISAQRVVIFSGVEPLVW